MKGPKTTFNCEASLDTNDGNVTTVLHVVLYFLSSAVYACNSYLLVKARKE